MVKEIIFDKLLSSSLGHGQLYILCMEKTATLILGNHLFAPEYFLPYKNGPFFMAEDHQLCTHFRYHKHKILLFLIGMRRFRDQLRKEGFNVHYEEFPVKLPSNNKQNYCFRLRRFISDNKIKKIRVFEIEDKFFEEVITKFATEERVELEIIPNPNFLTSRSEFRDYLKTVKSPFMKTFYENQRRKFNILMEVNTRPIGGKYSYDNENRKKLPKSNDPPPLIYPKPFKTPYFKEIKDIIEKNFSNHPGNCDTFWLATTRTEALRVFKRFLNERLNGFGTYQDAITDRSDFLYHSVISPYINMGLLMPMEVIKAVEQAYHTKQAPLNSCEGFIRQVLGWREFVRGIYQVFDEEQKESNFFGHTSVITQSWYDGTTGIPPLDDAIDKATRTGYNHHIERLMIVSNMMLLCRIAPLEVYRWFMEMFVDSSDWVMGPNVFGMGQFSDGGIFATKPYICGSNYIRKMSNYKPGPWCNVMDGLYWKFISDNLSFFQSSPRLKMTTTHLLKMDPKKKETLFCAANDFISNGFMLFK